MAILGVFVDTGTMIKDDKKLLQSLQAKTCMNKFEKKKKNLTLPCNTQQIIP